MTYFKTNSNVKQFVKGNKVELEASTALKKRCPLRK